MGLDITFFKTKRNDFINFDSNIYDNNGDNKYDDKPIYYFRSNYDIRNYLQSKFDFDINGLIIDINFKDIDEISKYVPKYYTDYDKKYFIDKLTQTLNKGYILYVECNW